MLNRSKNRNRLGISLGMLMMISMLLPFAVSCGKSNNISGTNTQLQIVNLSSDVNPLNLYINSVKQGVTTYNYPTSSGYFLLPSLTPPIQFRATNASAVNIPYQIDTVLRSNSKYTLFLTGYLKDSTIKNSILSLDTATVPPVGRALLRFVHASPSSPMLDIRANDTLAFNNIKFNSVTRYIRMPTGTYTFTINVHSTPSKIETTLSNVALQDGRAYTIYTQGIVGRTDSVAFGAAVLTNNLLLKTTH